MNVSKKISKDSLKELYNESKKRIKMVLNLLAQMSKHNQFSSIPDDQTLATLSNLLQQIMHAAQLEPDNQYRGAIIQILEWMQAALQKEFITEHHKIHYPHPLFVVKKGAELLHSFLHRDLRRKQFSSEENEIYQNYLALMRRLPNPNP